MTFCPSCGASIEEKDTYCPFCGAPTKTEMKEEKKASDYLQTETAYPTAPAKPVQPLQPIAAPGAPTSYPAPGAPAPRDLPQLEIRSFWMWFFLGIVTFGIASYVYLYYNIEDLNKLAQYPAPAGVKSTHIDTSNLVILVVIGLITGFIGVIMLIGTYLKFQKLHEYVVAHPQRQPTVPISGGKYIITSIVVSCVTGVLAYGIYIPMMFPFMDPTTAIIIMSVLGVVVGIISIGAGIYLLTLSANWQKAYNERARMLCPGTPEKSL